MRPVGWRVENMAGCKVTNLVVAVAVEVDPELIDRSTVQEEGRKEIRLTGSAKIIFQF